MKGKSNWLLFLAGVVLAGGVIFGVYYFLVKKPSLGPGVPSRQSSVGTERTDLDEVDLPRQQGSGEMDLSGQELIEQPESEKKADLDQAPPAFSIGGYLLPDNQTGEGWMVLYDDPATGSPAASLHLKFTSQSFCDFGRGEAVCDPKTFMEGDQIEVEGTKSGRELTVKKIKGVAVRPM